MKLHIKSIAYITLCCVFAQLANAQEELNIYSARKEVQELFDAHLSQSARVLRARIRHEIEELSLETHTYPAIVPDLSGQGHFYEGKIYFQVKRIHGTTWFM